MSVRLAGLVVLAVFVLTAAPAAAATRDRTPPTKPGNFRVTDKTLTSVSLAWNASTDNSGSLVYNVNMWRDGRWVTVATLPRTTTTHTQTGLIPNVSYTFWIEAVDPSGNRTFGGDVRVTLPRDTTPPPAPANLRVTNVTASQVSLAWDASADDSGIRAYAVGVTGAGMWRLVWNGPTSVTVVGLPPETDFSFTVRAQDLGYNVSPVTPAVPATTAASTDVTPPTAPSNLFVGDRGCAEVELRWTQSTDDQDPQVAIRYEILINGEPDPLGMAMGVGRTITYGVDGRNTFVLRAIDSAGNVSAPSNPFTLDLLACG
jgi:chitodextrinase